MSEIPKVRNRIGNEFSPRHDEDLKVPREFSSLRQIGNGIYLDTQFVQTVFICTFKKHVTFENLKLHVNTCNAPVTSYGYSFHN